MYAENSAKIKESELLKHPPGIKADQGVAVVEKADGSMGRSCWNSLRELGGDKTVIAVNNRYWNKADIKRQNINQLSPL